MRVNVRLFARLRQLVGNAELSCEVPAGSRVADVWERLAQQYPAIAGHGRSVSAALNAEYARMETPVGDGDEIAFLPPVSGG
jgi:molybdopterin converting factor subunit 1